MQYREFEGMLVKELQKQSEGMFSVSLSEVSKNNGLKKRAIILKGKSGSVSPTAYPEDYYRRARYSMSIPEIADEIIDSYLHCVAVKDSLPEDFFLHYETVAPHVYCQLVNRKKNEERLSGMPFEPWQDLAVSYYYQADGKMSDYHIQISLSHLEKWGIGTDQLRKDAWQNTLEKKRATLRRLCDILRESPEYARDGELPDSSLLVLTNTDGVAGAVAIAYPNQIEIIRAGLDSGFYMIPCSIHECLILPDDGTYREEELNSMVRDVNKTQLQPDDVLSDHVYKF